MSKKTNRRKRPMHRRFALDTGKRLLCGVLCMAIITQPGAGYATAKAEEPPMYLDSSRIEQDKLPEGDLLYFGTASANLPEMGEYAVKIYREGNLDKKVSVDIHTVDMTATYGEDYELNEKDVENLKTTGEKKTILEKYVKGQEITTISEDGIGKLSLEQKPEADEEETEAAKEVSLFDGKKKETAASTSSLAAKKEEQTGEDTREVSETEELSEEQQGFMDAIMESLVTDSMENLLPSSTSTVTFEKGQSEKTIRFSILEDDKSEGTEGFTLVLANPDGAEVYEVGSMGVSIQDDDKRVKSEISFTKSKYNSKDGKVTLTVKRTGAEYSVCEMRLMTSQDTAVAGKNYEEKNETIAFAPYEMEKTIEMEVSGGGKFSVLLSEFQACTEGKHIKAVVNIQGENAYGAAKKGASSKGSAPSKKIVRKKAEDNTKSFDITIDEHPYKVEYTMGENTGKILDGSYNPAVEAGVYYFSLDPAHGGNFNYGYFGGTKPNCFGNRKSEYIYDTKTTDTMDNNFGKVEYYHSTTSAQGWAATKSGDFIPGLYYQYLTPDWHSKSTFGGGQLAKFVTDGTTQVSGQFDRQQDNAVRKNTSDQNLKVEVYACDEESNMTPKSFLRFYGVCAMYRKLNMKVENPAAKTYLNGSDSKISMTPANMSVKCGAQPDPLKSGSSTRDVYANLSAEDTNFVFSIGDMSINNQNGIYAYINGYEITLDPGKAEDRVKVNYPQDFTKYLNNEVNKSSHKANLDFSRSAVDAEIKKIEQNLGTVPYDAYFFAWINSIQKDTANDGKGYRQNLVFKPKMEYYDVEVEVLAPTTGKKTVDGAAHFTDANLKNKGTKTYHAGDTLDLSVTCDNTDKYTIVGYQVSDNGGIDYNTITDTKQLFLRYDKKYKIRPVVSENSNAVEVRLSEDAKKRFEIDGLIPQSRLEGTEFAGKNILNLNPKESTIKKMAEPKNGKEYTVRVLVKEEDSAYAYRPVIKHTAGNVSYTTQYYSFVAAGQASDNIIEVGVSKVKKSDLKTYTVKGTLVSNISPVRQNGMAVKKLPVTGYTMSVGTGTQSIGTNKKTGEVTIQPDSAISTTNDEGEYTLSGITGVPGDKIPVCITNGIVNGQVVDVVLANGSKEPDGSYLVRKQTTEISYPYGAPSVTSIGYTYGKKESEQKQGGNTANTVHILDDTFIISAIVDNAGRTIKEAVFTVYHYGRDNSYDEYRVATNPANKNTFECKIPKMSETFHNGDGIKVHLVDSENQTLAVGQYDENGNPITDDDGNFVQGQQVAIEYPDRDTGLTFYTENEKVAPQTFDLESSQAVDVPLIGSATGNTGSGLLTFGKTDWPGKTGYTLQVGVDALFNTKGTPSTMDKVNGYQNMHTAAKQIASYNNEADAADKELANLNAEDFIFKISDGSLLGATGMEEEDEQGDTLRAFNNLLDEKELMQKSIETMKNDATSKAKKAKAGLNKEGAWSIDTALVLAFDFVKIPDTDEYVFSCGTVAIGGTFNFNKTKYTVISSVPAFINFSATLQNNIMFAYPTPEGAYALESGEFDGYVGNLADRLSNPTASAKMMISGKVQVGVGMCGVLSARGYASIKLQFDIPPSKPQFDMPSTNPVSEGGFLINATGGVGFDLLIISINFDLVNATWGFGTLESKTKFDFFGGMLSAGTKGSAKKTSAKKGVVAEGDTLLKTIGESERVVMHPYSGGTSDMSSFGKNSTDGRKKATLAAVSVDTLLENAAERTRPQIIPLDGGKKMVVFLANRASDKEHDTVLNYSVFDGKNWSVPKAVAEDSTTDSTPDILRAGNKVIIAWADANREFASEEKTFDMLNAMGISAAVYDIASGQMGEEVSLVDDKYFNLSPKLNLDGTKVYCSYMKRDLSKMKAEDDLTNFKDYYSTMAYVAYDYNAAKREEEELISIKHDKIKDPLVLDYTSCTTVVNKKSYMLATYTVDEDENLDTNEDRELFLAITNLTDDRSYYPIQISHDKLAQANPQLTDIDGKIYLTWLENGYIFHIFDASNLLEALFDGSNTETEVSKDDESTGTEKFTIDKSKYINGYMTEQSDNKDWYKKTAAELGMDGKYYEDSLYGELSKGSIYSESANLSQNEDVQTSIGNYKLVTNGDDIYIFFTDSAADENTADSPASVEIYGVRYQRMLEEDMKNDGKASFEGLQNDKEVWGFGKAVQITDSGKVIDELDLYMTKDSRVHAVSNYFDQWIDGKGQIQYSKNNLVEIEFETKNSMEVRGGLINIPTRLVAGDTENISFAVENAGLLPSKGFDYQVVQVTDGVETEIAKEHLDAVLNAGEDMDITVPWTIPENISGTEIKVTVTETGVDRGTPYKTSRKVPYRSKLSFGETQVLWDGQKPYVSTIVKNIGNAASKAYKGVLAAVDEDGNEKTIYQDFDLTSLASGEEKELTLPFTPNLEDFNSLGIIKLMLKAKDGEKSVVEAATQLVSSLPICARINDGKKLKLKVNGKTKLETVAAPWDSIAGDVKYASENPEIATVGDNGEVIGNKNGETTIHAYYPTTGVSASIPVEVSGKTAAEGTGKIKVSKSSIVTAAGKTKTVKFTATKDASASKAAAVKASVSDKNVISKVSVSGSKVKITVAKKAVKGASATVTLTSVNAAGKTVKAKIKVTVQNKTKKLAAKKTLKLKVGKKGSVSLDVTAQNNKKPATDTVGISSKKVSLVKYSIKKGKVTLTLKGEKKGTEKITVKMGSKKVKLTVKVN